MRYTLILLTQDQEFLGIIRSAKKPTAQAAIEGFIENGDLTDEEYKSAPHYNENCDIEWEIVDESRSEFNIIQLFDNSQILAI